MNLRDRLDRIAEHAEARPGLWLAAIALLLAVQISPWWYATLDGSAYLSLARSFVERGEMSFYGQSRQGIPPGYPLLISPAFLFGDRPFLALSVINWIWAVVLMLGVYRWMSRQFPSTAVLLTAVTMVNAGLWYYYRRSLKEVAFLAVTVWTANLLGELLGEETKRDRYLKAGLAGGLLVLAVLVRYSAVVLFGGVALAWLSRTARSEDGRWNLLCGRALGAMLVLGVLSVVLVGSMLQIGGTVYLETFQARSEDFLPKFAEGVGMRISGVGRALVPGMMKAYSDDGAWNDVNMLIYLPVMAVVVLGWWRCGRRCGDILVLTLPFYFVLYAAWPFDQGGRFMIPMLPVLVACFWSGAAALLQNHSRLLALSVGAHLAVAVGYWGFIDAPRARAAHQRWEVVDRLAEAIDEDRDKVLACGLPRRMHMMLQLALDREVPASQHRPRPGSNVRWIVHRRHHREYEGCVVRRRVEGFALLARRPKDRSGEARRRRVTAEERDPRR